MKADKIKTVKWYGILFALFVLFMYAMGIVDLWMMLSHNAAYYASHGYGQEVAAYFTNYPLPFLILWFVNLAAGFAAPLCMLLKSKRCALMALISFVADFALILFTSLFRNRIGVLGMQVFGFDLFILLLTLLFSLYCRHLSRPQAHSTPSQQEQ